MEGLLRLLPASQPLYVRYGATVMMVLLTFALRMGIEERSGVYGFILFIPAIVAASLLFDRGSGFLALVLSVALVAAALPWMSGADIHIAALASFLVVGGGLVFVSEGLHRALERAHQAEREKDLLLQEMTHRVKNKFAMISSMIGLQARDAPPETKAALAAVSARVRVIADVHDYLQRSRHDGSVEMPEYLDSLCRSLAESLSAGPVGVLVEAEKITLPADKALSVGLLVNELVTNAFKYAFPAERAGTIYVRLKKSEKSLELSVADNGVGCPPNISAGLGTRLVTLLAAQLGGTAKWEATNPGCRVLAQFQGS